MERKAFYSPAEVATILGLSSDTILNYIHAEKLFAVKLSERTYRIPIRVLDRWQGVDLPRAKLAESPTGGKAAVAELRRRIEESETVPVRV